MKGVILAAGVSSRLRPLTDRVPKCLLEPGGRTILGMTLENLIANGIRTVIVVTGYRGDQIRRFISGAFPDLDVVFVHNECYETTNNSYSLWLTRSAVGTDDILLLDSDIVFDHRIVGLLMRTPAPTCVALKRGDSLGEEEIKVQSAPDGTILRIGKDVLPGAAAGESIGIEKMSAAYLGPLYRILERTIVGEKRVHLFYEAAFQDAIDEGEVMTAVDVGDMQCMEIDTPDDFEAAGKMTVRLHGTRPPSGLLE